MYSTLGLEVLQAFTIYLCMLLLQVEEEESYGTVIWSLILCPVKTVGTTPALLKIFMAQTPAMAGWKSYVSFNVKCFCCVLCLLLAPMFSVGSIECSTGQHNSIQFSSSHTGKPEFYRSPPEEVIASMGDNITLECEAYTDPVLDKSYVWRHNGLRIDVDDTEFLRNLAYMQVCLCVYVCLCANNKVNIYAFHFY